MTPEAQAKRRARIKLSEELHPRRGGDRLEERMRHNDCRHVARGELLGSVAEAQGRTGAHRAEGASMTSFQERVRDWMLDCFGHGDATAPRERTHRFLEEALELAQANGCSADEARALLAYVFGRPAGELRQEIGGVMVTLGALCWAMRESLEQAGEDELARCWSKIDRIRAKHAAKPRGSALPGFASAPSAVATEEARLDFVLAQGAFIVWTMRDGSIRQCQLWNQDEDEGYHFLSGEHKFFNTEREAIDAAMAQGGQPGADRG
jgi:hypothetical protein